MKQIHLLPSGCQTWHRGILGSGKSGHYVYCSTLTTYLHDSKDHKLVRLASVHERTITGLSWSPFYGHLYATCGADQKLIKWDIHSNKPASVIQLHLPETIIPFGLEWAPHEECKDLLAVLIKPGHVHLWDSAAAATSLLPIAELKTGKNTVLRWNHPASQQGPSAPKLAAGQADGDILVWDRRTSTVVKVEAPREIVSHFLSSNGGSSSSSSSGAEKKCMVLDIQWEPLSNQYLIASYAGGSMALIDSESGAVIHVFTRNSHDYSMLSFVPGTVGEFVAVSSKAGVLHVYNVASPHVKETRRITQHHIPKKAGILAIKPLVDLKDEKKARFLIAFMDGSVCVYDYAHDSVEHLTEPAHSETIFDVRFKNSTLASSAAAPAPAAATLHSQADIFATASYDGSVKVWNFSASGVKCVQTLRGQEGVLYSLSWSPVVDDALLLSASSGGDVWLWDARLGSVIARFKHHSKPVYKVTWHPKDKTLIASAAGDGLVAVFDVNGTVSRKLRHPGPVYGADWCPFPASLPSSSASASASAAAALTTCPPLLATACHDGVVRVWDVSQAASTGALKPAHEFFGHTARAFNVAWSPLLPNRLASASDDKTVKVWNTQSNEVITLVGHTHNVRALAWNYEIPYILMTGSWDGTIRIWDIRTATCLYVIDDHHADVYGLDSHWSRPFLYLSSSRDTSLRVWSAAATLALPIKLRSVVEGGLLLPSDLAHTEITPPTALLSASSSTSATAPPTGAALAYVLLKAAQSQMRVGSALRLCGRRSLELAAELRELRNDLKQFALLFDFFDWPAHGHAQLWKLVEAMVTNHGGGGGGGELDANEAAPSSSSSSAAALGAIHPVVAGGAGGGASFSAVAADLAALRLGDVYALQHLNDVRPLVHAAAQGVYDALMPKQPASLPSSSSSSAASSALSAAVGSGSVGSGLLVGMGRREDRLEMGAHLYLLLGRVREACEMYVELQQWERALALAPSASVGYWRALCQRHAAHLQAKGAYTAALHFHLASGHAAPAVDCALARKCWLDAFLVAAAEANGNLPFLPDGEEWEETVREMRSDIHHAGGAHVLVTDRIKALADLQALSYATPSAAVALPILAGAGASASAGGHVVSTSSHVVSPIEAACCYLRVSDAYSAALSLFLGHELPLAFALARVLKLQFVDFVFGALASVCEELQLWDAALQCLLYARAESSAHEIVLLASRFIGPADRKADFYLRCGVRAMDTYAAVADAQLLKEHKPYDATISYIAANNYDRAATLICEQLYQLLSSPAWSVEDFSRLVHPLSSVPFAQLSNPDLVPLLLAYVYYNGALRSMQKNHPAALVHALFDLTAKMVMKVAHTNSFTTNAPVATASPSASSSGAALSSRASASGSVLGGMLTYCGLAFPVHPLLLKCQEVQYLLMKGSDGTGSGASSSPAVHRATVLSHLDWVINHHGIHPYSAAGNNCNYVNSNNAKEVQKYKAIAANMKKNLDNFYSNPNIQALQEKNNTMKKLGNNDVHTIGSNLPSGGHHLTTTPPPATATANSNNNGYTSYISQQPLLTGISIILEDNFSKVSLDEAIMWTSVCKFSPLATGHKLKIFTSNSE